LKIDSRLVNFEQWIDLSRSRSGERDRETRKRTREETRRYLADRASVQAPVLIPVQAQVHDHGRQQERGGAERVEQRLLRNGHHPRLRHALSSHGSRLQGQSRGAISRMLLTLTQHTAAWVPLSSSFIFNCWTSPLASSVSSLHSWWLLRHGGYDVMCVWRHVRVPVCDVLEQRWVKQLLDQFKAIYLCTKLQNMAIYFCWYFTHMYCSHSSSSGEYMFIYFNEKFQHRLSFLNLCCYLGCYSRVSLILFLLNDIDELCVHSMLLIASTCPTLTLWSIQSIWVQLGIDRKLAV